MTDCPPSIWWIGIAHAKVKTVVKISARKSKFGLWFFIHRHSVVDAPINSKNSWLFSITSLLLSGKIIFHFFFVISTKKLPIFWRNGQKYFFLLNMSIFCSYYVITNQYALRNLVDVLIVCRSKIGKIWDLKIHFTSVTFLMVWTVKFVLNLEFLARAAEWNFKTGVFWFDRLMYRGPTTPDLIHTCLSKQYWCRCKL